MNERALKFVLKRDAPKGKRLTCVFCGEPFKPGAEGGARMVIDHLDNNHRNNQYDNLAMCHQKCNQRKRTYGDYQLIALEKMRVNAAYVPTVSEKPADDRENENVRMSSAIRKFVQEWLELNCPSGAVLEFNESAKAIAYLLGQRYDFGGSPETVKRHLGVFCSGPAPWALTDVEGRRMISKRISDGGDDQ